MGTPVDSALYFCFLVFFVLFFAAKGAAGRLLPVQLHGRVHGGSPTLHLRDVLPHPPQNRHRHARR